MLGIQKLDHLARHLRTTSNRLSEVAEQASSFCEELLLTDPSRPNKKDREVLKVKGDLRSFQSQMLRNLLSPRHNPSIHSHGGVRGRHIKSNVSTHLESTFVFSTDISNFYPSISNNQVFELFLKTLKCHPAVSSLCTKLCTYRHHLALGLITSPILADLIMQPIDRRLAALCDKQKLHYSRFVDDITISGNYPITSSSYPKIIVEVLANYGFKVNLQKHNEGLEGLGRLADGRCITKLEVHRGRIRVRREFMEEVSSQLADAARLVAGEDLKGFYYMGNQVLGRIRFISWINQGQAIQLERQFKTIDWKRVEQEALVRGLLVPRKILRKLPVRESRVDNQAQE